MRVQSTVASCGTLGMGDGVGDCLGGVAGKVRSMRTMVVGGWWSRGPCVPVRGRAPRWRATGHGSVSAGKINTKPGESRDAFAYTREGERVSCKLSNSTLTVHVRLYALHAICYNIQAGGGAQTTVTAIQRSAVQLNVAYSTEHPTVPLPAARQIVHKARRPRAIMEPRESAPAWSLCRKQCRVSLGYMASCRAVPWQMAHGQTRDTDRSDRDCGALPYTTTAQRAFLPS